MEQQLAARVAEVRQRIAAAAATAGRDPSTITVVAAAKTRSTAEIAAIAGLGLTTIGENYVQEAAGKRAELAALPLTWRLIGHLQRNKAAQACQAFDAIDSVDSEALAAALQRQRAAHTEAPLAILLQIRLGGEPTKSGVEPAEADRLLTAVQQMPSLCCHGLMTMPPPGDEAVVRPQFAALRGLAEELRRSSGLALPVLSMGMSGDFEAAVAEGATHLRLGTVLFGPRA